MEYIYPVITDLDWVDFEKRFSINRADVVEIKNMYRHPCKLFVRKEHLDEWKNNLNIDIFEITTTHKWHIIHRT